MLIQPSLSNSKGANNIDKGAYIKVTSIKSTYIRDTYLNKDTGAGNIFFVKSTSAVKHSKIHLQSFWIP